MSRQLKKHHNSWLINKKVRKLKSHLPHRNQTFQSPSPILSLVQNPRLLNQFLTIYEPTTLIPNLNEIMEEYAELEDQIVQPTQTVAEQVEERVDVNDELEQTVEESMKRKRGIE